MFARAGLISAILLLPLSVAATAQEADTAFVYASYYECPGGAGQAAALIREGWGPIIQGHIQAGHVASYNVMTHDTGNEWTLALVHIGEDVNALLGALNEGIAEYAEQRPEDLERLGALCPRHEDYVWTTGPGNRTGAAVGQGRGAAGMSVYYICDEGREAVADLIVEHVWGPALDQQVSAGRLTSWAWLSHYLGGEYRRILVTDGPDQASLLAARDALIEAGAENPSVAAAFSEVCNGHQDVLWNVGQD